MSEDRGRAVQDGLDPERLTREQALDLADRRMRVLIGYAVEVWGPESDVDPEADNPSMRADLETFLDVDVAAPPLHDPD